MGGQRRDAARSRRAIRSPGRPRAAALFPDQQGTVVAARSQRAVRARRAGKAGRTPNFYPDGATKAEIEKWIASLPDGRAADRATGFFTVIRRAAAGKRLPIVPYNVEYQGELAARRDAAARSRGGGDRADAEGVSHQARGRVPLERLLRERRRLDGAEGRDRADDRSLRSLRGRAGSTTRPAFESFITVQDEAETPSCRSFPASCRTSRTICRSIRSIATRNSARSRRSSSSTKSSPPATATAACRRRRSICRTTSASCARRAPSASC